MTDNDDPIVPALILFHDWLRERLITQEGADPLGDGADRSSRRLPNLSHLT